jgi:hypothetical protein
MDFSNVFREERYYCNHLFRLLCHDKETRGPPSGLGHILRDIGFPENTSQEEICEAGIFTEVAVFRGVFMVEEKKNRFVDKLYSASFR